MSRLLPRFASDRRGVSAVEFALIAPLLILFYFGMAELTQALMAERRAGHAASAVGDLVAQTKTVSQSELNDIYAVAGKILAPFPTDSLTIRVSSVSQDSDGVMTLDWSDASGTTELTDVPAVPEGVITDGASVIISEVSYVYDSPLDYVIPEGVTLNKTYYLRPRKVNKVDKLN